MNLRDLKYLVALAEHKHFGKAAEMCFVSQPALSMQIKKLEEHLGVKLLERTNKTVFLTESGLLIAERAREILSNVEEVREIARAATDPFSGELRIGIFPTLAPYLLPHIIPQLTKIFPKIVFHLVEDKSLYLIDQLKDGKLHAAVLALPVQENHLTELPLFEEAFLLAVPHTHELAKKKIITEADFEDENLMLLEDGHCMRDHILSYCQKINVTEAKKFRATSLETLRHMVAAGVGITLMPRLSTEGCELATFIPISPQHPVRNIGLVFRNSSTKLAVLHEMTAQIRKIMQNKNVTVILKP